MCMKMIFGCKFAEHFFNVWFSIALKVYYKVFDHVLL